MLARETKSWLSRRWQILFSLWRTRFSLQGWYKQSEIDLWRLSKITRNITMIWHENFHLKPANILFPCWIIWTKLLKYAWVGRAMIQRYWPTFHEHVLCAPCFMSVILYLAALLPFSGWADSHGYVAACGRGWFPPGALLQGSNTSCDPHWLWYLLKWQSAVCFSM